MLTNFKKSEKDGFGGSGLGPANTSSAKPLARPTGLGEGSLIGADLTVLGNLVSEGSIRVDGEVQGDLHANAVVIGERATVTGGIIANDVVVHGNVMGSIRGKKVQLQSTSRVEGDIYHSSLGMEQGSLFEGKSRRSDDPTRGATPPEAPKREG